MIQSEHERNMEWYYAVGDKQMGPVADDEFKKLTAEGTIRPDTLVWHGGLDGWKPLREVTMPSRPVGDSAVASLISPVTDPVSGTNSTVVCRECGKLFKSDEVVAIDNAVVCRECEPGFRERSGANADGAPADLSEDDLLNGDYEVDISRSLNESWNLFQQNMGIMIGATVLVYLAMFAINMIPYLNMIIAPLLAGPLMGGLWYFYIRNNRGEDVEIGSAFAGFGAQFWQLVLANIVKSIVTMICMIPLILTAVVMFGAAFVASFSQGSFDSIPTEISVVGVMMLIATGLVGIVGSTVVSIAWLYSFGLIVDKGLAFWPALELSRKMVFKHFWGTMFLGIVCWLLSVIGVLMCGVGILFTGPVAFGAIIWHYERIFGNLRPES